MGCSEHCCNVRIFHTSCSLGKVPCMLERFSYDLEKWFRWVFVICFISQWMKRSKHRLFVFPPKKTLIWRRHCSIGQSCSSMTSKRSIDWFLESSRAWSFFTRPFSKPDKSHARLYLIDRPIISLYFRSFVVSVLFARFHFKDIRKSLYHKKKFNSHRTGLLHKRLPFNVV